MTDNTKITREEIEKKCVKYGITSSYKTYEEPFGLPALLNDFVAEVSRICLKNNWDITKITIGHDDNYYNSGPVVWADVPVPDEKLIELIEKHEEHEKKQLKKDLKEFERLKKKLGK